MSLHGRMQHTATLEIKCGKRHFGGKTFAIRAPVYPLEVIVSILECPTGVRLRRKHRILTIRLRQGRYVLGFEFYKLILACGTKHFYGPSIAFKKATICHQHHGIIGTFVDGFELRFTSSQFLNSQLALGQFLVQSIAGDCKVFKAVNHRIK